MAVTNYRLLIGQNIDSINFKMADAIAEGLQPIGPPIDFQGVIVQGVGNISGTVTVYEILHGDNAEQLSIRVAEAVAAGKQPLGNPTQMSGIYAQTVIVGAVGSDLLGATTYDLIYGANPEQLSLKVAEQIAGGKQPFGTPAVLNGAFVQAVVTPGGGGGGGANVGDTIIGYSGPGYAGFCNIILEESPAPETYPYIGRVEPPYQTAFVGNGANVPCYDLSETLIGTGQTQVADGLLTGVVGLDIPPPESHDVELDQGDTWTARKWNQADESAVTVTVAEDDGVFFGRLPEDATIIKHGDEVLNDPGLTANVQSGTLSTIDGAVLIAKDGDGPIFIENTAGGKNIQGTVVAATIGGVGGAGIRIDTPYNVVQNGDSLAITKLDGTTSLGASAICGMGADGNAVARFVGAMAVLEDQDEFTIGPTTYKVTIVNNVITALDTV